MLNSYIFFLMPTDCNVYLEALSLALFAKSGLQIDSLEASELDESYSKGLVLLCCELANGIVD